MPEIKLQCYVNLDGIFTFDSVGTPCLVQGFLNAKSTEDEKIFDLKNAGHIFGQLFVTRNGDMSFRILGGSDLINYEVSMTNIQASLRKQAMVYF